MKSFFPKVVFSAGVDQRQILQADGLVRTAAGLQVGPLASCQHVAALCLLGERALVGPTVAIHCPSLPLADVSVQDVLNVLHDEVYSNCREEWEIQDRRRLSWLNYLENVEHPAPSYSSFNNQPLNEGMPTLCSEVRSQQGPAIPASALDLVSCFASPIPYHLVPALHSLSSW